MNLKDNYKGNYGTRLRSDVIPSIHYLIEKNLIFGQVLDAGCGHGQNLNTFYRYTGIKPVGLDINKEMVKEVEEKGYKAIQHDLDNVIPFEDGSFHTIYCNQVLEHVESPYKVLKEFNRVLKPNGYLIVGVPNGLRDKSERGGLHINYWTPGTLSKTLKTSGFKVVDVFPDIPKGFGNWFVNIPFCLYFRRAFFVVCKKEVIK